MADGAIDKLSIEIGASSTKAVNSIKRLAEQLGSLREAVAGEDGSTAKKLNALASALNNLKSVGTVSIGNKLPDQLRNISAAVSEVTSETISKLDEMTKAIERLKGIDLKGFSNAVKAAKKASGQTNAMMNVAQPLKREGALVPMQSNATMQDIYDMVNRDFGGQSEVGGGKALDEMKSKAQSLIQWFRKLKEAMQQTGKGMEEMSQKAKKSNGPLGNLLSSLKRIAMYRFLRTVIKAITQAFQEGLQNSYAFSQGIAGEGHRFAAAMDSMSTAGLTMKNQLGSAFISLLTALQPIITAIIGLITRLADAMSQLFAIFTGGTYLKAAEVPKQWAEAAGGAGKAAKEWKNQLLQFDEINRLEEPSDSGGGGGGAIPDPSQMFQDTPIDGFFAKIRDKLLELKESLNFEPLLESWERLKESAKSLGDTILQGLGWVWENILVPLAHWTIEEAAPVLIDTLAKAFDFLREVLEKLAPLFDWLWQKILKPLFAFIGDVVLKVLEEFGDLLEHLADVLDGKLTFKEFIQEASDLELIILAVVVALGVVGLLGVIFNIINTISKLASSISGVGSLLSFFAAHPVALAVAAIALLAFGIFELIKHWDEVSEAVKNFQQTLSDALHDGELNWMDFAAVAVRVLMAPIDAVITLIGWIQTLVGWIKSAIEGIDIVNGQMSLFGGHVTIGRPKYAEGGFPEDGLFMANHGELVGRFSNGRTAVANNEQITAGIADAVYDAFMTAFSQTGGGMNDQAVNIYLDGRQIAQSTTKYQNQFARAGAM